MPRLQFSVAVRNARLNAVEATPGGSPELRLFSGPMPPSCTDPNPPSTAFLAEIFLATDWMENAVSGQKVKKGTWAAVGRANAAGGTLATYFRLQQGTYGSATTYMQGDISSVYGDGAMQLDDPYIVDGQSVEIVAFTLTDGNP